MSDITNNYRNQYKVERGMGDSFDQFWQKYEFSSKYESVKFVIRSIYNILNQDIKNSTHDNDLDQTIFDRIEFRDLCNIVESVLEKYISIEKSDINYTTDVARAKLISSLQKEIEKRFKTIANTIYDTKDSKFDQSLKDKIHTLLKNFFDGVKKSKTEKEDSEQTNKADQTKILQKIQEKLEKGKSTGEDHGTQLFKEFKKTDEFKTFVKQLIGYGFGETKLKQNISKEENKKNEVQEPDGGGLFSNNPLKRKYNTYIKSIGNFIGNVTLGLNSKILNKATNLISNTEEKNIKTHKDSIFSKQLKSISNRINRLGNIISVGFGTALNVVRFVFKPITSFFKSSFNAIIHPINTLKKLTKNDWLVRLLQLGFKNPKNVFMLGAFTAMIVSASERYIIPVIDHYVVIPAMEITKTFIEWLNPDKPGTIANIMVGLVEAVNYPIEILKSFFKPIEGSKNGGTMLLRLFLNTAKFVGVNDFPVRWAEKLIENSDVILNTISDIDDSPGLMGFAKSSKFSWILKPMFIGAMAAGNAMGKIYKKDENNRLTLKDQLKNDMDTSSKKIIQGVTSRIVSMSLSDEEKNKEIKDAKDNIEGLENELYEEEKLRRMLEDAESYDRWQLPIEFVDQFVNTKPDDFYKSKMLRNVLEQVSQTLFEDDFYNLDKDRQIVVLQKLLELRHKKAQSLFNLYKSNDINKNMHANDILREPVQLRVVFDGQQDDITKFDFSSSIISEKRINLLTRYLAKLFGKTPAENILGGKIDFSDNSSSEESMMRLLENLDEDSELGQFLKQRGITKQPTGIYVSSPYPDLYYARTQQEGEVYRYKDTKEFRTALVDFARIKSQQANEQARQEMVKKAFTAESNNMVSGGGSIPLQPDPDEILLISAEDRIRDKYEPKITQIVESQLDDTQKLQELKTIIDTLYSENDVAHKRLMQTIKNAYGIQDKDNVTIINNGQKPVGDLVGD